MADITVSISEDRFAKLKEVASRLHVTPEELVRVSIDELLSRPEEEFQQTLDFVLKKNAELYRRLA